MAAGIKFKLELCVILEVNLSEASRFQITKGFNATSMQQKSGSQHGDPDGLENGFEKTYLGRSTVSMA
jgi:hypothetical protein